MHCRSLRFVLLFVVLAGLQPAVVLARDWANAGEWSAGPLLHEFKLTLDEGRRTEAAGPFFYRQEIVDDGSMARSWAVPPLFSYTVNDDVDYEWFDFLWKGITYNRYGSEYRIQVIQLLSFSGGQTQSETNVNRFTLFPFYFQQRSKVPEKNYTALFPIHGTIRERLFRDEIKFTLFPAYVRTRKKDVVTDNYLLPFFHLRHGERLSGWQFWPLAGSEHKDAGYRTNHWGDAVVDGGHDKMFLLWPLYLKHRANIGTTNESRQHSFIPFYTQFRSEQRDSTSYPWPIGVTHTVDRARKTPNGARPGRWSSSRAAKARPSTASGRSTARPATPARAAAGISGRSTNTTASTRLPWIASANASCSFSIPTLR